MVKILTTHVGSLVRPDELVAILRDKETGRPYDEDAYATTLRDAVAEVVRRQAEIGIDVVSDGEFGKSVSWSRYVRSRLAGFEDRPVQCGTEPGVVVLPGTDKRTFPEFYAEYERTQGFTGSITDWVCTGPVEYIGTDALRRDIDNLSAALGRVDVTAGFLPVVAPASVVPTATTSTTPPSATTSSR